ncbi:SCO1664 family protein [Streptomyces sp. MP131-18]|uniref:SCO1664 family protein n=1 Tax=Streptomyces sp. MP131-18 TaxID=1857892 RepID=UPI0009A1E33E|nr:SCO1664 family protein [Streptomyces sp. MP131-18]ONK15583.1 Phosphatidylinositol 3- and 4-kinase [Streptomyces sp. MP131-18]
MSAPERIPPQPGVTADEVLSRGELTVHGRIVDASNTVLYATAEWAGQRLGCVYKPVSGERPLWDFPEGTLAQREVATYEVSRALGWDLVPPTVLRDGPLGRGMCQQWVGPAPGAEGAGKGPDSLLALIDAEAPEPGWKAVGLAQVGAGRTALLVHADDERLRRVAALDAVINNGDRKGGHLLPLPDGRLYGIDHGVTFHTDNKLRTLLWGWAGEPLPPAVHESLRTLDAELAADRPLLTRLRALLTPDECEALRARTATLLRTGRYPEPSGEWPAIPWPLV